MRGSNDQNHGLGWYGPSSSSKIWTIGSTNKYIDGPVLYGYDGGALGTNRNGTRNLALRWTSTGKAWVGTQHPDDNQYPNWRFGVDGDLICKHAIVEIGYWQDAVFAPDYNLMPLNELEAYVAKEHHLPEVPAENAVIRDGLNVGDMSAILMKKVEELTLYVLQLKKENELIKGQLSKSKQNKK